MARKLNAETAADIGHNQLTDEDRDDITTEACDGLAKLDAERDAFNAKQRQDRKAILHGKVKGALGHKIADFNALIYRPYKLKQDEENQEEFALYQNTMRHAHRFLKIGEQAAFPLEGGAAGKGKPAGKGAKPAKGAAAKGGKGSARAKASETSDDAAAGETRMPGAATAEEESEGITETLAQAGEKGFEAGLAGKFLQDNPFPSGSRHHQAWSAHWKTGQMKLAKGIKKGGGQQPAALN